MASSEIVRIEIAPGRATVMARSPSAGVGVNDIAAGFAGDTIAIGFNESYLRDALAVFGGGEVDLHFTEPDKPLLIAKEGNDGFYAVVMPAKTPDAVTEFAKFAVAEAADLERVAA